MNLLIIRASTVYAFSCIVWEAVTSVSAVFFETLKCCLGAWRPNEDSLFQPLQDKEFNTPACAYNSSSSKPSNGVFFFLNSISHRHLFWPTPGERDLVCAALFTWPVRCFACTKVLISVEVFVTIQPNIMRIWLYTNVACVEHIERD